MAKKLNLVRIDFIMEDVQVLLEMAKLIEVHLPFLKKRYCIDLIDLSIKSHNKNHDPFLPDGLSMIFGALDILKDQIQELQAFYNDCDNENLDMFMRKLLVLTMESKVLESISKIDLHTDTCYNFIGYIANAVMPRLNTLYDNIFDYFYNGGSNE